MPRDGSNVYHQPFPDVVTDTPIESTVYNGFVADVAGDLNAPRPIVAGGTGATSASAAIQNLGGEVAKQVVTNFDSHTFVNGSFYSGAGATGAPTANAFVGDYYENNNGSAAMLQARDLTNGHKYVKAKVANVWGVWALDTGFSSSTAADMYYGLAGIAPSSQFIINTENDVSGTNAFVVTKAGGAFSFNAPPATGSNLYVNAQGATSGSNLWGLKNGIARWIMQLGNEVVEGGANSGANLSINRYSDAGAYLGTSLQITRSDGNITFNGNTTFASPVALSGGVSGPLYVNSYVMAAATATTGVYYIGGNAAKYIACTGGTNIEVVGAPFVVFNHLYSAGTGGVNGAVWANSGGTAGMLCDGSNLILRGMSGGIYFQDGSSTATWGSINAGGFVHNATIYSMNGYFISRSAVGQSAHFLAQDEGGAQRAAFWWNRSDNTASMQLTGTTVSISQLSSGSVRLGNGLVGKSGYGGGYGGNTINFQWSTIPEMWVDSTYMGQVAFVSDYRTKKDVTPLTGAWSKVKALKPIKYTQKEFSPPSHVAHIAEQKKIKDKAKAERDKDNAKPKPDKVEGAPDLDIPAAQPIPEPGPMFTADNIERWGFMAHELQATLTPSAASGVKDDPNAIQSPNPWTVIAALTGALQEAMARIEALEARP